MSSNKDDGGWKKFIWDSDKGEFCGRTGGSWFKILGFYLIFYAFLAGVFIGTIQALLLTLSNYKPTWQDRVAPPGLSHTPRSDKSEIAFNLNDVETYLAYTKAMREFLVMYDDDKQRDQMKYEDCGGTGTGNRMTPIRNRGDLESVGDQERRHTYSYHRQLLAYCPGMWTDFA
ncbi:sodium/potassium-transporting ATPase subunit beta-233 [Salvelinus sp. IW2-2015]|uniref:sodium/potassium-transporting ATPase subunit beta-233 n=1 Tax=Salvelinus sp. IW2-2015 TaxID=2691554 RepID=UPI0038D4D9DE